MGAMAPSRSSRSSEPDDAAQPEREQSLRIGQAAELLGVGIDTLRRWESSHKLRVIRTSGGQRIVPILEVSRLLAERRRDTADRPIVAQSARNRFVGIVTRVERDGVAAVVEVLAGPHRLVSLMTAEAVDELDITIGQEVVCVVKSTNVIVEIPR
jgi:molybdopterin-binding protein